MAIVKGNPFANDRLHGTDRSDDMYGYAGNDVLMGSAGADHIDGGFGNDTVDYSAAPNAGNYVSDTVIGGIETPFNGVLVSLIDGSGFWGDSAGDTYTSIENVTGSAFNDFIVGDHNANVVLGGAGNDWIAGLGGADTLGGGSGLDILLYNTSDAAVKVDLLYNTAKGGHATGDIINGFEGVIGSNNFDDVLSGNNAANYLNGGDGNGNDKLYGLGGDDELLGGNGNDIIDGGANNDTITGGRGDDRLTGGSGFDTFKFNWLEGAATDIIRDFEAGDRVVLDIADPDNIDIDLDARPDLQEMYIKYQTSDGSVATIVFQGVDSQTEANAIINSLEFV
jgi:Ca2+-binding RTX toxin-like protein